MEQAARELFRTRWRVIRMVPRGGPPLVAVALLVSLLLGVLPVAFVVATSVVLGRVPAAVAGGLGSAEWDRLVPGFLLAAAFFVAQGVLAPVQAALGVILARRIDGMVVDELMAAATRSPGVAPLEDQEIVADLRYAARELEFGLQMWGPGSACAATFALLARYVQLIGYLVLIGWVFSWVAALGVALAVAWFRYGERGGLRRYVKARLELGRQEDKVEYVRHLAIQPPAGKEIRVFGLHDWLRDQMRAAYHDWFGPMWAARRSIYLRPGLRIAAFGVVIFAAVFAFTGASAVGRLTLTAFVLVMQASIGALRLSEFYPEADLQTSIGSETYRAVERFGDRIAAEDGARGGTTVPESIGEIRFEGVTFGYPGQERPVLDRLDLTIRAGCCTALVGLNGAGKTTLVKLLARLYEPQAGVILIDGVDIRSVDLAGLRSRLAVIFQDFIRYEASVADNVGLGRVEARDDRAGVRSAIDAMGLTAAVEALPGGLDTPLATHLTGGAELSGGQWQRVGLARALFALRHGASVVVLDEPTASLDVRAEARFFDEFSALTRGATSVIISHRFATVRHADQIVVLDQGRAAEQGTHDELLAQGGRYAHLFHLQAEKFAEPANGVETPDLDEVAR